MMPLPRKGEVIITIEDAYVTDWEPVIRCKDCKYFKQVWGNRQPSVCRRVDPLNPMPTKYMGFCSFGEAEHERTD